jgi:trimeric autotransporter adhesin
LLLFKKIRNMIHRTFRVLGLLVGLVLYLNPLVTWSQIISSVAGNGTSANRGDGGAATNASLWLPLGVAKDEAGNIYIADHLANTIRKVNATDGKIIRVAGTGTANAGSLGGGLATSTPLNGPVDVAVDASGNIYILDVGNYCIWKVNASDGIINKLDTYGRSPDNFNTEAALTLDGQGNIFLATDNRIRKINTQDGRFNIIAGNGTAGYSGDGGLATNALLKDLRGVAVDAIGNIYIAGGNRIRKINASDGKIIPLPVMVRPATAAMVV